MENLPRQRGRGKVTAAGRQFLTTVIAAADASVVNQTIDHTGNGTVLLSV